MINHGLFWWPWFLITRLYQVKRAISTVGYHVIISFLALCYWSGSDILVYLIWVWTKHFIYYEYAQLLISPFAICHLRSDQALHFLWICSYHHLNFTATRTEWFIVLLNHHFCLFSSEKWESVLGSSYWIWTFYNAHSELVNLTSQCES